MLLEIGTKSNSITEALLVLSFALSVCSNNVVKSISPGHPKSPLLSLPIPGLGPVPKLASPDDNIIPCENSKLSEISLKYPIPFTSSKLVPVEKVILEISAHSLLIKISVTNSSTV